jgi:hypothetical protein
VAKKTEAKNQAELDKEIEADEKSAASTEKETEQAQKMALAKAKKTEKLVSITLPRLDNDRPVVVKINNKQYQGFVKDIPESLALQLREMADKIVDRERNVHIGTKYQGTGNGVAGMRRAGTL